MKFSQKILRTGDFEKLSFFESARSTFKQRKLIQVYSVCYHFINHSYQTNKKITSF